MSDRVSPILAAIRAKVESLGFALDNVTLPVLIRREALRREELDPKSMITIGKDPAAEDVSRRRFGVRQTKYTFDVIVHSPYAGPDAAITPHSIIRDAIVDAFGAAPPPGALLLPGAPAVFELDARPADWLRPSGQRTEWDWHCCQVEATVSHP